MALTFVDREEILQAVMAIGRSRPRHHGHEGDTLHLLHDGKRAAIEDINSYVHGQALGSSERPPRMSAEAVDAAVALLVAHGFEVATPLRRVGQWDAAFSVGCGSVLFLVVESKGPIRNLDYNRGLESILWTLAELDATITTIVVDSTVSRRASPGDRILRISSCDYPVRLRHHPDIGALRKSIGAAAARTVAAARRGGNPTKRLRFELSVPQPIEPRPLADILAGGHEPSIPATADFRFLAKPPNQPAGRTRRRAQPPTVVERIHAAMQSLLYDFLVTEHGVNCVSCEQPMMSAAFADIVVKTSHGLEVFELKTSISPRECVRQALGQLLEYAYWPPSDRVSRLWVVGPRHLDRATAEYLRQLSEAHSLPLGYCCQPDTGGPPSFDRSVRRRRSGHE